MIMMIPAHPVSFMTGLGIINSPLVFDFRLRTIINRQWSLVGSATFASSALSGKCASSGTGEGSSYAPTTGLNSPLSSELAKLFLLGINFGRYEWLGEVLD
jgi:hypothetical protein